MVMAELPRVMIKFFSTLVFPIQEVTVQCIGYGEDCVRVVGDKKLTVMLVFGVRRAVGVVICSIRG